MDYKVGQALKNYRIDGLTDPQSLERLGRIDDKRVRAEAVAGQLEGVFYSMMLKAMRATVPDGGIDGKGLGRSQYIEMLDQEYAQMSGLPRDPRFHEALVRQIESDPAATREMMSRMRQATAAAPASSTMPGTNPMEEAKASRD